MDKETPTELRLRSLVKNVITAPVVTMGQVTSTRPSGALSIAIWAAVVPYLFFGLVFLVVAIRITGGGPTGAGILFVPILLGLIPIVIGALVGLFVTAGIYHIVALILKGGAKGTYDGLLSGLGFSLVPQLFHAPVALIGLGVGILYVSLDSSPPFFESFLDFGNASRDYTFFELKGSFGVVEFGNTSEPETFLRFMEGFWAFLLVQLLGFSILGVWSAVLGFIAFWQSYSFSVARALIGFIGPGLLGIIVGLGGAALASFTAGQPPLVTDISAFTRLTTHPADDYEPAWSPDGTRIAFISERDGNRDIYVMDVDGVDPVNVTDTPNVEEFVPSWSPDGEWIVYRQRPTDAKGDIWKVRADGTEPTQLTTNVEYDSYPVFSPDGTRIAFVSFRSGYSEIYVMNPDGADIAALTSKNSRPHEGFGSLAWSPDGTRIAFIWNRESQSWVYVMNADGSGFTKLTKGQSVAWSPDGGRIAFWAYGHKNLVMNADGSGSRRLVDDWGNYRRPKEPTWAPDGTRIAFVTRRYDADVNTDNMDIYVVNLGSGLGD